MADQDEESSGDPAVDAAFHLARAQFKSKKREVKTARDNIRKRQEEQERQEHGTAEEHTRIVNTLRQQLTKGQEALECQKRRHAEIVLELGTLRGRLTHGIKEQSEWESAHKVREQTNLEACLIELRKLRRLNPDAAAALATRRGDALLEG
jgi:hypothetical protein